MSYRSIKKRRETRRTWYANSKNARVKSSSRQRKMRSDKRAFLHECKNVPCMDCDIKYPPYVMDFDHRNPKDKIFNLASAIDNNVSWINLKIEISKCDIVCSNCHRIRTFKNKYGEFV